MMSPDLCLHLSYSPGIILSPWVKGSQIPSLLSHSLYRRLFQLLIGHYQWNFEHNFGWFTPTILIGVNWERVF